MKTSLLHRLVTLSCALLLAALFASSLRAAELSIAADAMSAQPLAIGATAPAVTVKTADGEPFDLGAALAEKPTVLVFYRGGWCPYCNKQLSELATFEPKFLELGYQIIAVSTDAPGGLMPMAEKDKIGYRLLSDRDMVAASAYGVAFRVDAESLVKYREYKIELAPIPGEPDGRWLPVPTVFIVGRDRVVRYVTSNPDFKVRLPAADLLAAAKAALRTTPAR